MAMGTIVLGSCVAVQGDVVRRLPDGRISIRVGEQIFTGRAANPGERPARPAVRAEAAAPPA